MFLGSITWSSMLTKIMSSIRIGVLRSSHFITQKCALTTDEIVAERENPVCREQMRPLALTTCSA
jgi:hypothetical protein